MAWGWGSSGSFSALSTWVGMTRRLGSAMVGRAPARGLGFSQHGDGHLSRSTPRRNIPGELGRSLGTCSDLRSHAASQLPHSTSSKRTTGNAVSRGWKKEPLPDGSDKVAWQKSVRNGREHCGKHSLPHTCLLQKLPCLNFSDLRPQCINVLLWLSCSCE